MIRVLFAIVALALVAGDSSACGRRKVVAYTPADTTGYTNTTTYSYVSAGTTFAQSAEPRLACPAPNADGTITCPCCGKVCPAGTVMKGCANATAAPVQYVPQTYYYTPQRFAPVFTPFNGAFRSGGCANGQCR